MIQEGVRLAVSASAGSNRVRVLRKSHEQSDAPTGGASSSSATPPKKTMKYIMHQYKPKNFQVLRSLAGISSDDFATSICDADLSGGYSECSGKSGSLFWYSADRKYIMKSISAEEATLLNGICSSYLRYVGAHPHSLLCKFYGMYKITTTVAAPSYIRGEKRASRVRSNTVRTTRFVIMNNVFHTADNTAGFEKFDLKGTTEDRFVKLINGNEVLKDINFLNRRITLPENIADCLSRVIQEDCEFLLRHGIMDYSLIVGVKQSNNRSTLERLGAPVGSEVHEWMAAGETRRRTFHDKLNAQLTAAKSAAVKAAHSVQKLLSPSGSLRTSVVVDEQRASRLAGINEVDEEATPPAEEMESPPAHDSPVPSVFSSFDGGVAGLDESVSKGVVYYMGIIDILQQYTVKKKLAHLIKKCTIGCCHEIDTVAPEYYKARFVRYVAGKVKGVEEEDVDWLVTKGVDDYESKSV